MKAVLISIQPKWCELIASGKKTIEVRKTRPKIDTPFKCYIYMTMKKPYCFEFVGNGIMEAKNGKVIGEFVCDGIDEFSAEFVDDDCYESICEVWIDEDGERQHYIITTNEYENPSNCYLCRQSCLSFEEIKRYIGVNFHDIPFFGWHISDLKIYDKPKDLREFNKPCIDKYQYCQMCRYGSVVIPPDEEEYALYHGGFYDNFDTVCHNNVTRPPQSWCYVEELG